MNDESTKGMILLVFCISFLTLMAIIQIVGMIILAAHGDKGVWVDGIYVPGGP